MSIKGLFGWSIALFILSVIIVSFIFTMKQTRKKDARKRWAVERCMKEGGIPIYSSWDKSFQNCILIKDKEK